jgi:hypothetical protein
MNRDDIIRMAREAGISTGFSVHVPKWDKPTWLFMRRFANLVAAAEREACAKVCEENATDLSEGDWDSACINCANHIRARGQQ